MQTVLIVIHLMIVVSLVIVVLLQRSEGGGLGMGGGSGFMTARGAANALTRATAILAAGFFATSLLLSILARHGAKPTDILDLVPAATQTQGTGIIDKLGSAKPAPTSPAVPSAPDIATPAAPAASDATAPVTPGAPAVPKS